MTRGDSRGESGETRKDCERLEQKRLEETRKDWERLEQKRLEETRKDWERLEQKRLGKTFKSRPAVMRGESRRN